MTLTSHATAREIKSHLMEANPDALLMGTGAWENDVPEDHALIGISQRCGQPALAVYSYCKLVEVFESLFGEDCADPDYDPHTAAIEWVDFNVIGGWNGDMTPIVLMDEWGE